MAQTSKNDIGMFFRKNFKKYGMGTLFLTPFLILFAVYTLLPVVISIGLSFTNYDMLQVPQFIGITNYRQLFLEDELFLIAIKNTLIFAVICGPTGFIASFFMAWIINKLKHKSVFSLAFYAPSITSGIAMSVVWLWIFSPDRYGFINNILIQYGFITSPILWNQDKATIMPVIIIIQIWMSMGTGFLVFLAGLQNLQSELSEAGKIDGIKNGFEDLFYIVLPQLKPQLLFGAISSITAAFSVFDIAVGFAGFPSPNDSAHTVVGHLYDYAFKRFEMGYASAVSVVLFLITFSLGRYFMKVLSSKNE